MEGGRPEDIYRTFFGEAWRGIPRAIMDQIIDQTINSQGEASFGAMSRPGGINMGMTEPLGQPVRKMGMQYAPNPAMAKYMAYLRGREPEQYTTKNMGLIKSSGSGSEYSPFGGSPATNPDGMDTYLGRGLDTNALMKHLMMYAGKSGFDKESPVQFLKLRR